MGEVIITERHRVAAVLALIGGTEGDISTSPPDRHIRAFLRGEYVPHDTVHTLRRIAQGFAEREQREPRDAEAIRRNAFHLVERELAELDTAAFGTHATVFSCEMKIAVRLEAGNASHTVQWDSCLLHAVDAMKLEVGR